MMLGAYRYDAAARQHGDTFNGLVLIVIASHYGRWLNLLIPARYPTSLVVREEVAEKTRSSGRWS